MARTKQSRAALQSQLPSTRATTTKQTRPSSTIRPDQTIPKTKAKKKYKLNDADMAALAMEKRRHNIYGKAIRGITHLYNEREVEQVAWDKYGGPVGLRARLSKSSPRRTKKKAAQTITVFTREPQATSVPGGGNGVDAQAGSSNTAISPTTSPFLHSERLWSSTDKLRTLKAKVEPWVWSALVKAAEDDNPRPLNTYDREREAELAVKHMRYPPRPTSPLPPSPSMNALRKILAQAPRTGTDQLAVHEDHEGNEYYLWPDQYLAQLFPALLKVVTEFGTGEKGWETMRWEVYDKYTECISGIEWQAYSGHYGPQWHDAAAQWLCGTRTRLEGSAEERCNPLGARYTERLPKTAIYGRF